MNSVVQRGAAITLGFCLLVAAVTAAIAQTPPTTPPTAPPGTPSPATSRRPLAMAGLEGLFQRIIVRTGAVIAERPDAAAPSRPVPGFSVFYVYARQQVGQTSWLEVGEALDGRTQGWIAGAKAIDWKHNLVLAFNNPAGRERALFFANADVPRRLWLGTQTRAAEAARYRREALATPPDPSSPVIAVEPETYVDITRQFYFLPVLSAEPVTTEQGQTARLLEVISAPAPSSRRPTADAEAMRNYKGVVVFVVDTTISMEPYIVQTREAIKRVIGRIRDTAVRDNFRFGLIAYRDHMGGDPALEYVTQPVYLPSFADAPDAILPNIEKVQQAKASNRDWDEDAVAGLKLALDKVNWSEFGGRYIVLITDAGTRDAHDPLSETRLGIAELKALARTEGKQIAIHAIHLRTPAGQSNHARAEQQYRELTDFGPAGALYHPVPGGGEAQFRQAVDFLTDSILQGVAQAIGHPVAGQRAPQTEAERQMAQQSEVVGTAMRLSYLGRTREQAAPDVVKSFVLDEDPADPTPAKKPLDVRVLLTKNQLSDLAMAAHTIITAANANRLSPDGFFDQVRAATGATTRDPRRLAEALRQPGTFTDFLKDLPYNSPIMEITPEQWKDGMLASERRTIINALEAKLRLYEELNNQPSLWVGFDGRQGTGEAFYPLPLDQLP
jgi:hypothetical protein